MSSNADIYHEMIIDYSRNPVNYGHIENPDVTFHDSNPLCGDSIDIDMKIDDNTVSDIKFHGKGCAICMACSSVLTEITKGKSIDEVRKIDKTDVLSELGLEHLQAVRIKCALLSLKVLKSALYSYLGKHMQDSKDVDKLKEEAANLY
ncbi:MAG: iron-sulfur cluster assembly scaffold protein [Nitrosarchaeum sp.]|nr:iron-sulfur cluster assembly scaffold protein [Nitrosarchaeum sp.]MCV0399841.1 iron-sulfur cluster assembly scaffold protein [Nitrosarchaeum sp.]